MKVCNMFFNAEGKKAKDVRGTFRGRMNKHGYANQKPPQRPAAPPHTAAGSQVDSSGTTQPPSLHPPLLV